MLDQSFSLAEPLLQTPIPRSGGKVLVMLSVVIGLVFAVLSNHMHEKQAKGASARRLIDAQQYHLSLTQPSFITEPYHGYRFITPVDMSERMRRGVYETSELKMIEQTEFFEDDVVVELGGCLGVVAVATNRLLPPSVRHIVVEANPRVVPVLRMNRDLNNCTFEVEHCMVSDTSDGSFTSYDKIISGSAHRMDNMEVHPIEHRVPVKSTSDLPQGTSILIVYIEGGEKEALEQILPHMRSIRIIMVEIHEFLMYKGFERDVKEVVARHGFYEAKRDGDHYLYRRSEGRGERE